MCGEVWIRYPNGYEIRLYFGSNGFLHSKLRGFLIMIDNLVGHIKLNFLWFASSILEAFSPAKPIWAVDSGAGRAGLQCIGGVGERFRLMGLR